MKPVIQQEQTGCAIASSAAIAGITYPAAKKIANNLGIYADDSKLWSETDYIRKLLAQLGVETAKREKPFTGWDELPDCALLSTKWHLEKGRAYWHWVVFVRDDEHQYVLDSKKSLRSNVRTDFGRIKPKWYIEVKV
ncbi:MAG: hypothetical protein OQK78_03700 [Gammaproteobacteria bacterium]|nr:hypothetical protein [Gammaproteobacteria bacterium]